jgi:hypothetical protein
MRAIWNGKTIAESDDTIVVEGNHYFPAESLTGEYLRRTRMVCVSSMLASWSAVLNEGHAPRLGHMLNATAWAVSVLLFGALSFMSRERDFAARI